MKIALKAEAEVEHLRKFLQPAQVGVIFNRTSHWVLEKVRAGAIRSVSIDGSVFITVDEIERLRSEGNRPPQFPKDQRADQLGGA
jgi:hypothetical protein